jgi:hypothetical protein
MWVWISIATAVVVGFPGWMMLAPRRPNERAIGVLQVVAAS